MKELAKAALRHKPWDAAQGEGEKAWSAVYSDLLVALGNPAVPPARSTIAQKFSELLATHKVSSTAGAGKSEDPDEEYNRVWRSVIELKTAADDEAAHDSAARQKRLRAREQNRTVGAQLQMAILHTRKERKTNAAPAAVAMPAAQAPPELAAAPSPVAAAALPMSIGDEEEGGIFLASRPDE